MNTLSTPSIRWEMRIVISMCLGYGMLMLCRTVVGVAGPAMLADPMLTLDTATFGAILGWGTAGNLSGKLTTGVLADKLGGSKVFIWAVGLASIATFIFGTLSSNIAFFALYFLTVFAKSAGWPSMANIIRVSFIQAKHGRVWGFIATSSRVSSVATTVLVSSLLLIMSWRGLFYMAGVLALDGQTLSQIASTLGYPPVLLVAQPRLSLLGQKITRSAKQRRAPRSAFSSAILGFG